MKEQVRLPEESDIPDTKNGHFSPMKGHYYDGFLEINQENYWFDEAFYNTKSIKVLYDACNHHACFDNILGTTEAA